jgi:hypothetical protein
MRKLTSILFILLLVVPFAVPASAQDDMGMIVCDSTLITLLYVAQHDFGYSPMMDVSTFEKGQYAPLFDAMMMMEEGEMAEGEMMEEMTPETMMEEGEMAEDDMMGDMMMLAPGNVEGEPAECTELRASLESFFYDHFSMMSAEGM